MAGLPVPEGRMRGEERLHTEMPSDRPLPRTHQRGEGPAGGIPAAAVQRSDEGGSRTFRVGQRQVDVVLMETRIDRCSTARGVHAGADTRADGASTQDPGHLPSAAQPARTDAGSSCFLDAERRDVLRRAIGRSEWRFSTTHRIGITDAAAHADCSAGVASRPPRTNTTDDADAFRSGDFEGDVTDDIFRAISCARKRHFVDDPSSTSYIDRSDATHPHEDCTEHHDDLAPGDPSERTPDSRPPPSLNDYHYSATRLLNLLRPFRRRNASAQARHLPLKPVAPPSLHLGALTAAGARFNHLLSWEGLRPFIDLRLVDKLRQRPSPALRHHLPDLLRYGWYRLLPRRHRAPQHELHSLGFTTPKSDGVQSRWVVDALANRISRPDIPTRAELARLEDFVDAFLLFRGGREDDGVSYYGQHPLDPKAAPLFASSINSRVVYPTVMPQGWQAATCIAQDNLVATYRIAHANSSPPPHRFQGHDYIDNHLALSDSLTADAILVDGARRAHASTGSVFTIGVYTTMPTFAGVTMSSLTDDGSRLVSAKPRWLAEAQAWLLEATEVGRTTVYAEEVCGVLLWALRASRRCFARFAPGILRWLRQHITGPAVIPEEARAEIRRDILPIMRVPRVIRLPARLLFATTDATTRRMAAIFYTEMTRPVSVEHILSRTRLGSTKNPLCAFAEELLPSDGGRHRVYVCAHDDIVSHGNVGELAAMLLAVLAAPADTILAIISDSTSAIGWTRRGTAPAALLGVVSQIASTAEEKNIRIVLAHVAGSVNPADAFSRHDRRTGFIDDVPFRKPQTGFRPTAWV